MMGLISSYKIVGGDIDSGLFTIDDSGNLSFSSDAILTTYGSADGNNIYKLRVQAIDNLGKSTVQDIEIELTVNYESDYVTFTT